MKNNNEEGPVEPQYVESMRALGQAIDVFLNEDAGDKQHGFCLLMFPLEVAGGRVSYLSNARREDMIAALKEFISNAEAAGKSRFIVKGQH